MAAPVAPVQVGIFTNDLCIGFRIIMHEVLDNQVYRVFEAAKEIHRTRPKESFRTMYERGMKSVNAWENQMKERFRAQVIAQYRQLTDLYHHIYLMYVQEMYDQSMDDVTVRVNIPAMSTMLHMFLRLACNHQVILSGEYVTTMSFSGRVLFVETILRRLLYELLVQQNNIKSISTAAGRSKPRLDSKNTISVHSEEDMVSADMLMGTQRQSAPRLSPVNEEDRFWVAPNESESMQSSNNSILSQLSGGALLGPAYNTSPRNSPLAGSGGGLLSDLIPARNSPLRTSPQRNSPQQSAVQNNSQQNNSQQNNSQQNNSQQNNSQQNNSQQNNSQQNNSQQNSAPPPLDAALATFVSPTISAVLPPPEDTVLTTPAAAVPAAAPAIIPDNVPRITSLPNNPIISGSVVAASEKSEPLFELKSQFTPFKPGGVSYPDAKVPTENRRDIDVDSLQLQPSDQDFAEEARRLLQADQGENTVTPFDSVTNIANGDRRPPLFFDPVRAAP